MNPGELFGLKKAVQVSKLFNNYYRIHQNYTYNYYKNKLPQLQKHLNKLINFFFTST